MQQLHEGSECWDDGDFHCGVFGHGRGVPVPGSGFVANHSRVGWPLLAEVFLFEGAISWVVGSNTPTPGTLDLWPVLRLLCDF